jgi:HK97 family phage major capsid protein
MPIDTGSFTGVPFPPDVQTQIINLLIDSAPLAASLTRQPTDRSAIAWPTAKPTGFAWLRELQPFPTVDPGDDAYVVATCKIGGIIDLSNESISDTSINLTGSFTTILRDSLSRDLDLGLLHGEGPPEPVGIIGVAAEAAGADLLEAVTLARGEIGDAGGGADTIAWSATGLAQADATRDDNGQLVYPGGFAAALGLTRVVVPQLDTPLVFDKSRCYLVVRNDVAVDMSRDWHFHLDATSVRVKGRFAAAIPDPAKAIRKLAIGGAGPVTPAKARPAAKTA